MTRPKKGEKKKEKQERLVCDIAAAVCVVAVGVILSVSALDGEKYKTVEDERVSVAITFEEPERPEDKGFWELFCESLSAVFSGV